MGGFLYAKVFLKKRKGLYRNTGPDPHPCARRRSCSLRTAGEDAPQLVIERVDVAGGQVLHDQLVDRHLLVGAELSADDRVLEVGTEHHGPFLCHVAHRLGGVEARLDGELDDDAGAGQLLALEVALPVGGQREDTEAIVLDTLACADDLAVVDGHGFDVLVDVERHVDVGPARQLAQVQLAIGIIQVVHYCLQRLVDGIQNVAQESNVKSSIPQVD